ncbi:MFS transporter [Reticulibacter mediterranei]|uniref:MFS transporter n=1 Tax=Reticulibacter mediterranei TaxID=2778369 RepID=A0A8J3IC72_9CHLR|nr:sugar porter family MFS transporter [Reticulibacter mediterranei]GHO90888.1 MFS transporter [Reticulibacter mediterranei]
MTLRSQKHAAFSIFSKRVQSQETSDPSHHHHISLYFVVTIAAIGGLLVGYDTAVISGALLFLRVNFTLTPFTEEITVSAALLGATIGALTGGKLSDIIGRRKTLIAIAITFIVGALLTSLARSLPLFIALRILVGLSIGATTCVVPVYISEMAPPNVRGTLVTFNQLAITIGIAIAYWVDLAFATAHMGWPPMYAVTAIPGTILFIGMLFNEETPRWLARKGRWDEAYQILEKLRGMQAKREMEYIRVTLANQQKGSMRELLQPGLRTALCVGVGLAIFDQLVGINTVIYYAPTIFGYAGFTSASSAILATGVIGIVNVLATIVASTLIDKIGRRPLLQWGSIGMAITLGALGTIFAVGPQQTGYLTLAVLLIYIVSFALSMGPVVRLMNAEIYPTRLRAMGSSIASFANWNANLLVSFTFLSLIHLLGKPLTFWLYAFLGILAFIFSTILVPETKGKSLEQIEHYWRNGRDWEAVSPPPVVHTALPAQKFSEHL